MSMLWEEPTPTQPDLVSLAIAAERRLGDIAETLSEIASGIHTIGANQARAMRQEPPAYNAEDFGFDLLIPNEVTIPHQAETLTLHRQQEREMMLREALAPFANREAEFRSGSGPMSKITDAQWDRAFEVYTAINEPCTICSGIDTNKCPGGHTWAESGLHSGCAEKQAAL